ncbi:SDR family oxidoreductase [Hufsiella ginkgonis]|uniref:SDR family NAD(P)-dependent oxidoreductase n=1 Tax=Hufsiella ginkgonis TaxID=2695274 RepID=A0A7K1Y3V4_9SPHI|nr:SDR family oxidoreductase [Hufsiella ginkgonis]MXV17955.1 SDR family NAD(P)-dependent oxidoreductase [Hufsiella ginkgonis]
MNAVITGATKGIGRAIALKLASAGYHLALCSRNQDDLERLLAELRLAHPALQIHGLQTDCSDKGELIRFADFVHEHFKSIDVLVNNAGVFIPSRILDEEDDLLSLQLPLNLGAPYRLCKIFGRQMRQNRSGHIINICSVAAIKPVITAGSYTVTKFALLGLTRVLREELMPYHVKVTAILPGSTLTESWGEVIEDESRFVAAADIASAVLNCLQMSHGCNVDELLIRPVKGEL